MITPMPGPLEQVIYGFPATAVAHLADKHGITGYLIEHGPASAKAIAAQLGLDADTTDRMLLVLAACGVAEVTGPAEYALAAAARPYLASDSPYYIGGFLRHLATGSSAQLGLLERYLRYGKQAAGTQPPVFDQMYQSTQAVHAFLAAMWDLTAGISADLVALAGLGGSTRLVDVGGGQGPFTVAALRAHPGLYAVIFDLPQVAEFALARASQHDLASRLQFTAGDAFTGDLPAGDALCFANVLSDWPDDRCLVLLQKAYQACRAGGRVLIIERLFSDRREGPLSTASMNLLMHLEMSGRHRSAAEYISLLRTAGFSGCEVRRSAGDRHLVIGHKPATK
jgi:SAM-dependent methyltransferase